MFKISLGWGVALWLLAIATAQAAPPFPALYPEPELFQAALARKPAPAIPWRVTGLTVPHHLLAADLIADAFSRLRTQHYHRVIILCPDHFHRSATPFAVSVRDFQTVLGPVALDREATDRLLACPLVGASNLFSHEHGVQALTPFLAHHVPKARLVAVAIRATASPKQWKILATALTPLLDAHTLLVQSTDFSHYLTPAEAARMDQQTLRLVADPDPEKLLRLNQPRHVDCLGALFLQRTLQRDVHHAAPITVANRNSQAYATTPVTRSTSYMVQYYGPPDALLPGPNRFIFTGDAFFGRFMAKLLARPGKRTELVRWVRTRTGGVPLVVNLEGVLSPRCPTNPGPYTLCMPQADTLRLLRDLGVTVAVLANNHAKDLGPDALRRMAQTLRRVGILPVLADQTTDIGPLRLAALTDLDNADPRRRNLLTRTAINRLITPKQPKPLFVMIHWGAEFTRKPDPRVLALGKALTEAGAQCIIGCHPHHAWPLTCDANTCQAWSLGNFLFDQSRPDADGELLEVRFFPQGTYALRRLPIGNLYRKLGHHP
ncbi:AmmeMemoRadiSam system protein B [Solidesulfovibrio sp. C21]|uniref:AmmeMemoRadiSam system protein B n=1 Tax=Solidesulfovibrio sp. C21 TaxID=3398613 RepID=UPI0039FDA647